MSKLPVPTNPTNAQKQQFEGDLYNELLKIAQAKSEEEKARIGADVKRLRTITESAVDHWKGVLREAEANDDPAKANDALQELQKLRAFFDQEYNKFQTKFAQERHLSKEMIDAFFGQRTQ